MIIFVYEKIFARRIFYRFNKALYFLSLKGMGVLNCNDELSGEHYFLTKFFKNMTEKPVVFDVGANVGNYAKNIRKLSVDAEIYAFEPHPITFQKLNHLGKEYKIKGFNIGFGNKNEIAMLYDYKNHDGSEHASVYRGVFDNIHHSAVSEYKIDIQTIDRFVEENNIKQVHLLKIDTEGNELRTIEGARNTIEKKMIDVIQFEFNEMNIESRVFMKDFYDLLTNYSLFRLLPDGLVELKYSPIYCEIFSFQNIIAVRKDLTGSVKDLCEQ